MASVSYVQQDQMLIIRIRRSMGSRVVYGLVAMAGGSLAAVTAWSIAARLLRGASPTWGLLYGALVVGFFAALSVVAIGVLMQTQEAIVSSSAIAVRWLLGHRIAEEREWPVREGARFGLAVWATSLTIPGTARIELEGVALPLGLGILNSRESAMLVERLNGFLGSRSPGTTPAG